MAQLFGAMFGTWLTYILYIDHYKITKNENIIRSTFCTAPAIRNLRNNIFSEALGTFILVFGVYVLVSPNIELENNYSKFWNWLY